MSLTLDLVTRFRNVHWAGGFLIVMRNNVYLFTPPKTVSELHFPATNPTFLSSSCGRIPGNPPQKVLLVSAMVAVDDDRPEVTVAVFTSNNGRDWRWTFRTETGPEINTTPNALVQTPNGSFYFDLRLSKFGSLSREQVFKSLDGETWTGPIADTPIPFGAETAGYRSAFPSEYCTHNNCKDTLGQNVPDGFMRNDTKANVLMRPKTPITINYGTPSYEFGNGNEVEKVVSGGTVSLPVSALTFVDCVAGAGATWVAGGRSGAAVSFDTGATWNKVAIGGDDEDILSISSISV